MYLSVAETLGHGTICVESFHYIWMHLGSLPAGQVDGGIENFGFRAFSSLYVSVHYFRRVVLTCLSKSDPM